MEKPTFGIGGKISEYTEYDNGYLIRNESATYYIPKKYSDTTNTIVYAHGSSRDEYWRSSLANSNPDAIFIMPTSNLSYNNMNKSNDLLIRDIKAIQASLGIKNPNMTTISHSMGGQASVYFLTENIERNPGIGSQTCVLIDPSTGNPSHYNAGFIKEITSEQLKTLADNQATIIGLEPNFGVEASTPNYKKLGDAGINTIVIGMKNMGSYYNGDAHCGTAVYAFNHGLISYLAGQKKIEDVLGKEVDSIWQYNQKTHEFEKVDMSNIAGYVDTILASYGNFASREYHSKADFDSYASTVSSLQKIDSFPIPDGDAISNDEKAVYTVMNEIRTNIKNTALIQGGCKSVGCQSTTAVPTCAEDFLGDYFAVALNLSDKIEKETQNAANISAGLIKTDKELEEASEKMVDAASRADQYVNIVYVPIYGGGSSNSAISNQTAPRGTSNKSSSSETPSKNENKEPIELKPYSKDSLLTKNISTKVYDITGDDLNRLFKHWADITGNQNSPLIGTGNDWVKACDEAGIDPLTLIGICGEETGRGGFAGMDWMNKKNYVGMRYIDPSGDGTGPSVFWGGRNDVFETNYDAILASAKRIKNFYGARYGGTTIQKLAHTGYTGHSDSKGEWAKNERFANMWASIMKESLDYITGTNGGV